MSKILELDLQRAGFNYVAVKGMTYLLEQDTGSLLGSIAFERRESEII